MQRQIVEEVTASRKQQHHTKNIWLKSSRKKKKIDVMTSPLILIILSRVKTERHKAKN